MTNDCVLVAADVPKGDAITQTTEDLLESSSFGRTFYKTCHVDVSTQTTADQDLFSTAAIAGPCTVDEGVQTLAMYDQAVELCKAEASVHAVCDVAGTSSELPVHLSMSAMINAECS